MSDDRKLKRGLKDLSPIFALPDQDADSESRAIRRHGIKCISLFSAAFPSDSLFLNTFFASQMAARDATRFIVTVDLPSVKPVIDEVVSASNCEILGPCLERVRLGWSDFNVLQVGGRPLFLKNQPKDVNPVLFLDVDYSRVPDFGRVVPLLDKWVFVVQPTFESLSETYKLIKGTRIFNRVVEYFLVFEGKPDLELGELLFEGFSSLLMEELGIVAVWLGYLQPPKYSSVFSGAIDCERLFWDGLEVNDTPQKLALLKRVMADSRAMEKVQV